MIKTSKELQPLADYLLGNLLIVDDLKLALQSKELNGWGLVDQSGAYSGSDLILKNRQVSEHGNLIGREKKLDSISLELLDLIKNIYNRPVHLKIYVVKNTRIFENTLALIFQKT